MITIKNNKGEFTVSFEGFASQFQEFGLNKYGNDQFWTDEMRSSLLDFLQSYGG